MSSPLDAFVDLANAQGPAYPNGDKLPWTAARPRDFALFSMFMLGRDRKDFMSAGTSVKTAFDAKIHDVQFGPRKPASDLRRGSEASMYFMETPLTEYDWQEELTFHEFALQPGGVQSPENVQKFWDIKKKKDADFVRRPMIDMEEALSAAPTEDMFDDKGTGLSPIKSLWTVANLWETRHYASGGGENLFPVMANQQGLDPEDPAFKRVDSYGKSYTNGGSQLAPTKVSYATSGAYDAATANTHLFSRMKFWLGRLGWKPIPMAGSYADAMEVMPSAIMCTDEAILQYDNTARAHGDLYATIAPVGDPAQATSKFNGIPFIANDSLRDAEIYPDVDWGNSSVSGGNAAAQLTASRLAAGKYITAGKGLTETDPNAIPGGRYYAFDPRCVNIWFSRVRPWGESEWYTLMPQNKDKMARYGEFIGNLHAESFVQNGILFPSAAQANYAVGN